ncbi:bifunctional adenosylcobinamide kinase/adenosylcobinamide-phosphate guanylyltransferase [Paramuribaculum intestinale]|uniref:bifunctional adenosylcobinamide kinase/adenosylcobinamide-phosphate guanylyltransferase n=1 Tax=Paramuribaculum intestinale TaxID=2094151 RepID=UPI00272A9423|nr:bifunctional adenosylcobinamide kinase/adenosylcobinamide-phosphate guanylyltransferase [Paramuribaculum intestinale]
MAKIIMITGGQRSGKSELAEKTALRLSATPLYVATAVITDEEMARRVESHRCRRGSQWRLAEEKLWPSRCIVAGDTALIDCVTVWSTNMLFHFDEDADKALKAIIQELDTIAAMENATIVAVTNEIGLGGISPNPLQRKFTDLQGLVNRHLADIASEVYLTISGIPVKIK